MADSLEQYALVNVEGLEHLRERGRGCYGAVYEITFNGVPCIAKKLHNILLGRDKEVTVTEEERTAMISKFRQECLVLSRLRHPNIVQFLGVCLGTMDDDVTLVMEYVHMDLDKCIRTYPNMPLQYKVSVLRDVAYGLSYLHSVSVIHRDLNQGNVLLTESLTAKIADLGASKVVDRTSVLSGLTTAPGAIGYMPPEAQQSPAIYDSKLDCFSFGHLALYLLNSKLPNLVDSNITAIDTHRKQIQRAKRRSSLQALGTGHILYNVVSECLCDEPHKRPSSRELATFLTDAATRYPVQYKNALEFVEIIEKLQTENATLTVHGVSPQREDVQDFDQLKSEGAILKTLGISSQREYVDGRRDDTGKTGIRQDREPRTRLPDKEFVQLNNERGSDPRGKKLSSHGRVLSSSKEELHKPAGKVFVQLMDERKGDYIQSVPVFRPSRNAPFEPTPVVEPESGANRSVRKLSSHGSTEVQEQLHKPVEKVFIQLMDDRTSDCIQSVSPGGAVSEKEIHDYDSMMYEEIPSDTPGNVKIEESKQRSITPVIVDEYDSDADDYEFAIDFKKSMTLKNTPPTASLKLGRSPLGLSPTTSPTSTPLGLSPSNSPSPIPSATHSLLPILTASVTMHSCIFQKMPREIAEALCCVPGDYLVRVSPTTNGFVLSSRLTEDECGHLSIHKTVKKSLRSTKTHYFFNEGELFDNLTDLISDLASSPFMAEANKCIVLKRAVTKESRKILRTEDFISGGILVKKRQYTLSSSVMVANKEEVTVKVLASKQHEILWEAYILSQLDHQNIIRMAGVCIETPICLLMEECAGNCITDFLTSHGQSLDNLLLSQITHDLAVGMSYLHSQNLIHRNLAARNCVMDNSYTVAKVANFQRCCAVSKDTDVAIDFTNFAIGWAAPEILSAGEYSKASDVWSFGVLMWEVFHLGKEPYRGLNKAQIIENIQTDSMIQLPPSVFPKCVDAFNGCLKYCTQRRPTFTNLHFMLQDDADYI